MSELRNEKVVNVDLMNRSGFAPIFIIIIIVIALVVGGGAIYYAKKSQHEPIIACTQEAKQCPDGSYVGRTGPNCEFAACPSPAASSTGRGDEGKFCGGIAAFQCPAGYVCKLDGAYPDAGGRCVVPDGTGMLRGQVTIGPNCPVERADNPCVTPPEAYASREFLVTQNGKTITSFHADASGNYIISLAPGTYTIVFAKTGIGFMSKNLPGIVTIKANESATLNIDVDTGIR